MGAACSKVFVNRMLRDGVDEASDIFAISGDNARFDSSVNYFEELCHAQLEDDNNEDARTNLLLSGCARFQCSTLKEKKASPGESGRAAKTPRCDTSTVGQTGTDSSSKILY